MFRTQQPIFPENPMVLQELRQLIFMWAVCCCSPILYLGLSWILKHFELTGFYPLPHDNWVATLVVIGLLCVGLQMLHVILKLRTRKKLAGVSSDPGAFMKLLTRRTFTLILISELPVFSGFCLYILQGDLASLFGFGLVSMLFYAQSHPRSALPAAA